MNLHQYLRPFLFQATVLGCLALLTNFLSAQQDAEAGEKKSVPLIRIICVASLAQEHEVIIASRDEEENWIEHSTVKLRSSSFSEWLPVTEGQLHIATRNGEEIRSICQITYPEDTKRAILVLLPDSVKRTYRGDLLDPAAMQFTKGSTLLINYSQLVGTVKLSAKLDQVKPGERKVMTPIPSPNGMFRMLIAYLNKDSQELIPCYDRYIGHNQAARTYLFLFPNATGGLHVFSLPEFGPFD